MTTDYASLTVTTPSTGPLHDGFVARHAMVTKVRGSFNEFEGTIHVDGANPANISAEATVKGGERRHAANEQRNGHLLSGDFFEQEKYPTMTFRSTGVHGQGRRRVHPDRRPDREGTSPAPSTSTWSSAARPWTSTATTGSASRPRPR